jgi:Holliday junction resolvase RusA-like endonuclease
MNHLPAVVKPDTDNIAKSICDAMNGIVYLDDKQVWYASVERYWDINGSVQVIVHGQGE